MREGFVSGALGGDPTGTMRENSTAKTTTNLGSNFLVDFQQKGTAHEICDEFLCWHEKGRWEQVWQQSTAQEETVQTLSQLIFEADFLFIFNRRALLMKHVMNFDIDTKMVGWSRLGSRALGGDQTGSAWGNSAGNATTNCLI